jgi:WD40 repeat protein
MENILVRRNDMGDYEFKIADFGLSKYAVATGGQLKSIVGTPEYCAPEIVYHTEFSDPYTIAADIFSLGAVIYFILYGESLFESPTTLPKYIWGNGSIPDEADDKEILQLDEGYKEQQRFWRQLIAISPSERPNTRQCLAHPWLTESEDQVEIQNSNEEDLYLLGRHECPIKCLASFGERDLLASGGEDFIKLWNTKKRALVHSMPCLPERVPLAMAFSPDGSFLASTDGMHVEIWDMEFGNHLRTIVETHLRSVRGICLISSDELMWADTEGVHVVNSRSGDRQTLQKCFQLEAAAASQNGRVFVAKDGEGVKIILRKKGKSFQKHFLGRMATRDPLIQHGEYTGPAGPIGHIAVSSRKEVVAATRGNDVIVWEFDDPYAKSSGPQEKFQYHGLIVAVGEEGDEIAYVSNDGVVHNVEEYLGRYAEYTLAEPESKTTFTSLAYIHCGMIGRGPSVGIAAGTHNGRIFIWP